MSTPKSKSPLPPSPLLLAEATRTAMMLQEAQLANRNLLQERAGLRAEIRGLKHENTYLQQTIRSLHWSLGSALDYVRAYQKQYGLAAKLSLVFGGEQEARDPAIATGGDFRAGQDFVGLAR